MNNSFGVFVIIIVFCVLFTCAATAADKSSQCIQADDSYPYTVTQCADGTVTVINKSAGTIKICSKGSNSEMKCNVFTEPKD